MSILAPFGAMEVVAGNRASRNRVLSIVRFEPRDAPRGKPYPPGGFLIPTFSRRDTRSGSRMVYRNVLEAQLDLGENVSQRDRPRLRTEPRDLVRKRSTLAA